MNDIQKTNLLLRIHGLSNKEIETILKAEFDLISAQENTPEFSIDGFLEEFETGIKNLNANQFKNILNDINTHGFDELRIQERLGFYEIPLRFQNKIIDFFKGYKASLEPIKVEHLDITFKGVQVATRDNFNDIINNGYTGDWVVSPQNIRHRRIQIASMNETGSYPRGYFINADIVKIEPVYWGDQLRQRIFISNPIIVNSGNTNIRFNMNPVSYIY